MAVGQYMNVRLTVIGSSPAWPNPGSAQSGYLVESSAVPRRSLLLDCGPGVLARLRARFGGALDAHAVPTRPGHARVDLGALAQRELEAALAPDAVGAIPDACTRCDALRFESYRRDGARAGRLLHWVRVQPRG